MGLHRVVRSREGGMTTPEAAWLMSALHPDPVQQQDSARAALCPALQVPVHHCRDATQSFLV